MLRRMDEQSAIDLFFRHVLTNGLPSCLARVAAASAGSADELRALVDGLFAEVAREVVDELRAEGFHVDPGELEQVYSAAEDALRAAFPEMVADDSIVETRDLARFIDRMIVRLGGEGERLGVAE
jgi:hypothetical protein